MHSKSATLFVAGFLAHQTLATGWTEASAYSCPGNTNNHCSPSQHGGYNWSGLQGGKFSSYGSNQFSGFTCSNSFGKRDLLSARGFQEKCITGSLDDGPSMSGGSFSINQMQISSSEDTEIDCHYDMPDGSTCKETHSCSPGGSIFQNTQCGGAKSVTFKPGKNAKPGCTIGVHSVGFHCSSASAPPSIPSTSVTVQSASHSKPTHSKPTHSKPTHSKPAHSKPHHSKHPHSKPPPQSSSPPCYGHGCTTSAPPAPPSSSSPPCYGAGCSSASSSPVASSPPCYGSGCSSSSVSPVSSSVPPPPPTSSPPCYGPGCAGSSTSVVPQSVSSAPPSPHHPHCPEVLPRCLKTWMFVTNCKSNSDHGCFCSSEKLIKKVMACLSAWSPSDHDTQAAASYLMGLCAEHVGHNPAIITACPSGVHPGPPPPTGSVSVQGTPPCTTITYSSSLIIPATFSTGVSQGLTCSGSSMTTTLITTVTVPRVSLTTSTITVAGTTSCSVGLGAPTPSSAVAWTTQPPPPPPPPQTTAPPPPPPPPPTSAPPPPPPATTAPPSPPPASVVCSEFTDGQPQCFTSMVPPASAASVPAPPVYSSSSPVAAVSASSTWSTTWGTGTAWASTAPSASSSPIIPATGAGAKLGSSLAGLVLAAFAALAV